MQHTSKGDLLNSPVPWAKGPVPARLRFGYRFVIKTRNSFWDIVLFCFFAFKPVLSINSTYGEKKQWP